MTRLAVDTKVRIPLPEIASGRASVRAEAVMEHCCRVESMERTVLAPTCSCGWYGDSTESLEFAATAIAGHLADVLQLAANLK